MKRDAWVEAWLHYEKTSAPVVVWSRGGHNLVPKVSSYRPWGERGGKGLSALSSRGIKMGDPGNEVGGSEKREEYLLIYRGLSPSSSFYAC